jgi:crotonobetainyl-CoA:carnitine CoA-transferase CaiB-like acyl-CoA transferase
MSEISDARRFRIEEAPVPGALDGLLVVDLSHHIAGPLTAMALGDLGAEVIRVDPPGGPRFAHPANALLQRGKKSIVLDLSQTDDRAAAAGLIDRADVLVESFRPGRMTAWGLDAGTLLARNERLIHLSLPGFAADDPRAEIAAWEGVIGAAAGFYLYPGCSPMDYVGDRSKEPVYSAIPQASGYGAAVALHSVAAALVARERAGFGQHIDMSLYEAAFELIGANAMKTSAPKARGGGFGAVPGRPPQLGYYQGSDGRWLELCLFQDRHLEWFAKTFLPQEWIDEGMGDAERMLSDPRLRERARERYRALIASRAAGEWEIRINEESGASAAICQTSREWLRDDEHARDSGAVIELADPEYGPTQQAGYPVRMSLTPPRAQGPRHRLDADRADVLGWLAGPAPLRRRDQQAPAEPDLRQALAGIRVLDVSQVLAGPTTSRVLAEYGADVIKIHSIEDRQLGLHLYTNSGKQSVMLNLKTAEGMEIFGRLADGIDVFVQNFTRGVADRMGVGEQDLRRLSPEVIYASISAFGHDGYRGGWRGREQLGQGPTGMQLRLGGADGPQMAPFAYCDYSTGNFAAFAVLIALYHRLRTGKGQHVHASLAHSATFLQIPYMVAFEGRTWDEPSGQQVKGWGPLMRLYQGSDGRWLYLSARDSERQVITEVTGAALEGLADPALETALGERFATRPAGDWAGLLQEHGIGAHLLMDFSELMEDPYAVRKGLSLTRSHPGVGEVTLAGPSPRLSRTPARSGRAVGPPGSDTRSVLRTLGYADVDIDRLVSRDVVRDGLPDEAAFVGMFR